MRLRTTFTLCALILGLTAQAQISTALGGSCWVSDSAIVRIAWNSLLNCPSEPAMNGYSELGFHCGYNSFAGSVTFDDPAAMTAVNDGTDTFRVEIQLDDYFGYDAALISSLGFVLNLGVGAPDPWAEAGRDTIPGGFGCEDLTITLAELAECPTAGPVDTGGAGTGLQIVDLVKDLNVQPNPATDQFVLTFTNTDMIEMDFFLTDMTGRVVRQQNSLRTERVEVIRNDLAPGIYTAILRAADGRMSVRRVVLN